MLDDDRELQAGNDHHYGKPGNCEASSWITKAMKIRFTTFWRNAEERSSKHWKLRSI